MALLSSVGKTVQTTPSEITEKLVQVVRIGGPDDGITDRPLLMVHYFGIGDDEIGPYDEAKAMAAEGTQIVLAAGCTAVEVPEYEKPVLIDRGETASPPVEVAYQDVALRRKTATYRLHMRRPR